MSSRRSLNSSVNKFVTNKYVLYFVFFLAITNVLGYIMANNLNATILFILSALVTYNFTKNMVIVLGIALIVTNTFTVGNVVKEGFREGITNAKETKDGKGAKTSTNGKGPLDEAYENETSELQMHTTSAATEHAENEKEGTTSDDDNVPSTDGMHLMKKKNRIDYASTINDAYGDLSNILNSDGIKNLTSDTKNLMDQQLQLASAMKNMGPLMESAKSMLKGFDIKGLTSLLNNNS